MESLPRSGDKTSTKEIKMQPITFTFEELVAHREAGVPEAAIAELKSKADAILTKPTIVITDNKLPRPSGNPHDYVSMGPYWWPNPDTKDGLPWVNRDGQYNPDATSNPRATEVYSRVMRMALAEFYIGGGKYAEYAVKQLYDWFMNPDTYMTPHATYAQGIPGICEGRSVGLIDFAPAYQLFNGIAILDNLGCIPKDILDGVTEWFFKFSNWILTHEYGLGADNSENNHGSWHDANVIATAAFLGRAALVRKIAVTAYSRRVLAGITEDGRQPHELRRTQPLGYSFFNLRALFVVANVAKKFGFGERFWSIDDERGGCVLKSAVDFLRYFAQNPDKVENNSLYAIKPDTQLAEFMSVAAKRYPEGDYSEAIERYKDEKSEWLLVPLL